MMKNIKFSIFMFSIQLIIITGQFHKLFWHIISSLKLSLMSLTFSILFLLRQFSRKRAQLIDKIIDHNNIVITQLIFIIICSIYIYRMNLIQKISFKFTTKLQPFHLAIPVNNMQKSMHFYGQIMGCSQGRKCKYGKWIDYNFYGHQLVCHFATSNWVPAEHCNDVDKQDVPVPHFGIALTVQQWMELKQRLYKHQIKFIIQPTLRFKGHPGEQYTMFFKDPTGNSLQFKAMTNPNNLFAKYDVQ